MPRTPDALTAEQVAQLAGILPASFAAARSRGKAPEPDYVGRDGRAYWRRPNVERWLRTRRARHAGRAAYRPEIALPSVEPPSVRAADPVGLIEVAARIGRAASTVHHLASADPDFPPARWTVSGARCWDWGDLVPFLVATGRLSSARG